MTRTQGWIVCYWKHGIRTADLKSETGSSSTQSSKPTGTYNKANRAGVIFSPFSSDLSLRLPTDHTARIIFGNIFFFHLLPWCVSNPRRSVELHQTGTFEGRSTNWATALRQEGQKKGKSQRGIRTPDSPSVGCAWPRCFHRRCWGWAQRRRRRTGSRPSTASGRTTLNRRASSSARWPTRD